MRLSRRFIENLLLIGRAGPRILHDSAVQIDVWAAYGERPDRSVDVLLSPMKHLPAAKLAARLVDLAPTVTVRDDGPKRPPMRIFPLEGFVAVKAGIDLFLDLLLPLTSLNMQEGYTQLRGLVVAWMRSRGGPQSEIDEPTLADALAFGVANRTMFSPELRVTLLYLLLKAPERHRILGRIAEAGEDDEKTIAMLPKDMDDLAAELLGDAQSVTGIAMTAPFALPCRDRLIWQVSRNRPVELMGGSVETVKADAARRLFQTSARSLTWAVIDSGIDSAHPAFRDHDAGGFATRVIKTYDFSILRDLAAYDVILDPDIDEAIADKLTAGGMSEADASAWIAQLREDARNGRPFDWGMLEKLLETPGAPVAAMAAGKPVGHGTHVAGVLAGDWRENDKPVYQGVCPDLRLYDLRILGDSTADTEFAVIAALEFVRWLNARNRFLTIHGVNLSIGLVHDVRNFACGQTPVCRACDATVRAGVVVVAAAGNWGYQDFTTATGGYKGYATVSIADPGNTESVITVGATHRDRPHEYGVSFFSSRGPTGDGRNKPDIVAPGEKILGPLPDLGLGDLDGTSMSAPHVSGVAALLMARHAELVGQPMTIKRILMDTATDLGRERHFQGAGLVDALRALQSR